MKRELIYPDRQRCRTCRRYFGFEVLFGLYCTRDCAGLGPVPSNVEDWPRQCRSFDRRAGAWQPKVPFRTEEEAREAATRQDTWYRCDSCGSWHIATNKEAQEWQEQRRCAEATSSRSRTPA